MAEASKDTIYIDVDDDITGIIDKVASSKNKIVALVLPKRATSLQSIVNMKLLKRKSDSNNKSLVLITSESSLLPLAGAVGLHVAKTLQSKPAIPAAPDVPSDNIVADDTPGVEPPDDFEDEDSDEDLTDQPIDKKKPVGELAAAGAAGAAVGKARASAASPEDTIDIDDDGEETADDKPKSKKAAKDDVKADKKLKVPNFNSFRKKLLIGGGVFVGLIILWIIMGKVLPKANVTIITDNVSVNTDVNFTASTDAKEFDEAAGVVPATEKSVEKTDAEKVSATGKKNIGEKATGTVSLKLTNCNQASVTVPAGTNVTNGSLTFVTQAAASFNSVKIGNVCKNDSFPAFTTGTVNVVAQNAGGDYNISGGRTFTVSGFSNVAGFDSSAMSGGTDKEVTVVSQNDVNDAADKLKDKSKDEATKELEQQLKDAGLFPLPETLASSKPSVTASPTVGTEADDTTVTSITTYTMIGVKRDDLKALVVKEAETQIDTSKQKISNDGLDDAIFKVKDKSDGEYKMNVQSTVSTGAQEDQAALKQEIAGKKAGEAKQIITSQPGVKDAQVHLSPFWVTKIPSNPDKVTIVYQKPDDNNGNQD